jgi:hypothetical protein
MKDKIYKNSPLAVETTFYMLKEAQTKCYTDCLELENLISKKLLLLKEE